MTRYTVLGQKVLSGVEKEKAEKKLHAEVIRLIGIQAADDFRGYGRECRYGRDFDTILAGVIRIEKIDEVEAKKIVTRAAKKVQREEA
jgi:hypothetical protein